MNIIGNTLGGHYQVLYCLGKGGFGETYVAKDTHLPDKPLRVVKRLQPQFSDPDQLVIAQRLFDTEAQTLYKLGNHEQIPQLFAHFQEDQDFFLVQEYIDGSDLSNEIYSGKQLSESEVIELLREVLKILRVIHQQGVIHRDIKPSNLMRRASDGKIIMIDFGAIKQVSSQTTNTQGQGITTIPLGTLGYTPSEQLAGNPQFCSDIYALGIIGIKALTGLAAKNLPRDSNSSEIIWREKASVSPELAAILDKMVRQNFHDRYQSADEVLKVLSATIPVSSPLNNATNAGKLKNLRFHLLVGFLTVGFLATVVGILFIFPLVQIQLEKNPDSPTPTVTW
ncbi:serine/threonine protein kinase [Brasilonema octagenarum UFV-E1]|uniref:non-specific serine/threonine protein kinase n=2 Tax=Brasilonema TaxID=383614 RepID=A0A856MKI8_9CYAN|nr:MULTISPECIES: serine/threonine-protein kinase [Brasilonema]NMF66735.1 serine/threonine protein kinase [Brasilonema octagenarum UFV-OR1]QDL11895.1 serine/threonine protein kinase [Brasilonema sennae CENA114]QDL18269.1 serine/threonine protein kinase [Brasilonema octagenarum UFV-E1]